MHVGDTANFGGSILHVSDVAVIPLTTEEAREELGSDYLAKTLIPGDWGYQISFEGDCSSLVEDAPQETSITVERIAPLSVIFKNRD